MKQKRGIWIIRVCRGCVLFIGHDIFLSLSFITSTSGEWGAVCCWHTANGELPCVCSISTEKIQDNWSPSCRQIVDRAGH